MKKYLSILIVCIMLSGTMVVCAGETSGKMTDASNNTHTEWGMDFSDGWTGAATSQRVNGFWIHTRYESGLMTNESLSDPAPFKEAGNTYLRITHPKGSTSRNGKFAPQLTITGMAAGEKLHLSFDLKNDDFLWNKRVILSSGLKYGEAAINKDLVTMNTAGYLAFNAEDSEMRYTLGQWYHFDVVLDYAEGQHMIYYYVDGELAASYEDTLAADYTYLVFTLFNGTASNANFDSTFCMDDISVKILDETAQPVIGSGNGGIYSDFSVPTSSTATDMSAAKTSVSIAPVTHASATVNSNKILAYSIENGVFGKGASDKSLKISSVTGLDYGSPDVQDSNVTIAVGKTMNAGDKFKDSFAFAFDGEKNGFNMTSARIKYGTGTANSSTNLLYLFSIIPSGKILIKNDASTPASVSLEPGKWYNIEVIGSFTTGLDMQFNVYVNGYLAGSGTHTYNSAWTDANGDVRIQAVRHGLRMVPVKVENDDETFYYANEAEIYYDELYFNTYKSGKTVLPNTVSLTNGDVDLTVNGKILLADAAYTVESFLSGTEASKGVTVYKDGAAVTGGEMDGTLVVLNGASFLPVYRYALVGLAIGDVVTYDADDEETPYLTEGKFTAKANVVLNKPGASAVMIMAEYEGDQMVSVALSEVLTASGELLATMNISKDSDRVKIMLLDSLNNLSPYKQAVPRIFE